jgi:hypothetical protein
MKSVWLCKHMAVAICAMCILVSTVWAGVPCGTGSGITIPGANDADGVFDPTGSIEIDLSDATTVAPFSWETASGSGDGVYDPGVWAVIFKYSSVDIGSGEVVTFANHPSGAPVVWLVSGDVTVDGTIELKGEDGVNDTQSIRVPPLIYSTGQMAASA